MASPPTSDPAAELAALAAAARDIGARDGSMPDIPKGAWMNLLRAAGWRVEGPRG